MKPIVDESVKTLFKVKFIRVSDVLAALFVVANCVWIAVRLILGRFDATSLALAVVTVAVLQAWAVLLCFRACYYVLQCRADVNMMTAGAARMVHAYLVGGAPGVPPPAPGP